MGRRRNQLGDKMVVTSYVWDSRTSNVLVSPMMGPTDIRIAGKFTDFGMIFGRPFVKRFALCYQTVVCPVCTVTKRLDGSR